MVVVCRDPNANVRAGLCASDRQKQADLPDSASKMKKPDPI